MVLKFVFKTKSRTGHDQRLEVQVESQGLRVQGSRRHGQVLGVQGYKTEDFKAMVSKFGPLRTSWTVHADNITASVTTLGCVSSMTFSPDTSLMSSGGRSVFSTICSDILLTLQIDQQNKTVSDLKTMISKLLLYECDASDIHI